MTPIRNALLLRCVGLLREAVSLCLTQPRPLYRPLFQGLGLFSRLKALTSRPILAAWKRSPNRRTSSG
jgi:hypothetical protein